MHTSLRTTVCALLVAATAQLPAHSPHDNDNGIIRMYDHHRPVERVLLRVPDVGNYETLKCDLHIHTVFSDGLVWPTIRVQEAWREGLDAIAISDHIEYQPHKADLPTNHNRAHEIAADVAKEGNVILIKGSEITRMTPPGHFNAIFIEDASHFIEERETGNFELDQQAIDQAAEQDAFIFWNHPGWKVDSIEGSYEWQPFVENLREEGKLHGIEIMNSFSFYNRALDWALDRGLAVMGSSDVHNLITHDYDTHKGIVRTMTLLFVKERSAEGIRDALDAGRTVAWSTDLLAGHEKWIRGLYEGAVTVGPIHATDGRGNAYAEITNDSDLYFELERTGPEVAGWPEKISLNPGTTRILRFDSDSEKEGASYMVTNAFIRSDQNLVVQIKPGR